MVTLRRVEEQPRFANYYLESDGISCVGSQLAVRSLVTFPFQTWLVPTGSPKLET
jgi:hypothetical protein